MSTASINPADIKIPPLLGNEFEGVLGLARKTVEKPKDEPKKQETLDPQAYEDALNELAVSMGESVNVKKRNLVGIDGSERHRELFKALVEYKLKEQAKNGKQVSVEAAMEDAIKDLRGRYENAVGGGKDGKDRLNVLDGYWDKKAGKDNAADLAVQAYRDYFSENLPDTANSNYEDNLNALAAALVGGVNTDNRTLAVAVGTKGPLAELYKNLITAKLKEQGSTLNLEEAIEEVEQELFDRFESAASKSDTDSGDIVDVIKGHWDRHTGRDNSFELASSAYGGYFLANPPDIGNSNYEDNLNALASALVGGVITDNRTLAVAIGTKGPLAELYKNLVTAKLKEQGSAISLDEAIKEVEKELFDRFDSAATNIGADSGDVVDVIKGHWDRHAGRDNSFELAGSAFRDYFSANLPDTGNSNYEDNLNALAAALVGGVNIDNRTLAVAIGTKGPLAELYKNLITAKLKEQGSPTNLEEAMKEVEKELFDRLGSAATNAGADSGDVVDVIKGYWDRHAGKEDVDGLAREAAKELRESTPTPTSQISEIDPDINYDDTLNSVASNMADGTNTTAPSVTPFTDKSIRDEYASLIYHKLQQQKERGDPVNLDAAYDEVKSDLYDRLPNALRNDPKADEKMELLNDYWNKSGSNGKSNASAVAREAYAKFLAENTVTNNPDYEDNLNALALALGNGTIDETRTLSGLSDPTLSKLYQNLITDKLKGEEGLPLDDAIAQVKKDVIGRLDHALDGDGIKNEKITMVKNYWDKHSGAKDATRAAETAYAAYVEAGKPLKEGGLSDEEKKNLLAPSSTDIMNADTADGKTVNQKYMENLEKEYENEPEGSDKAKFLLLLQAQNSLAGGFGYLPYYYEKTKDLTIYADDSTIMDGDNFRGLVDEDKLKAEIEKLAQDPEIAADTQEALQAAVGEIKDKQGLEDRIVATMTSPTYKDELEKADLAAENGALIRYSGDLNSLSMLNPEKAQEVKLELSMTSTVEELNKIIEAGPGGIDDDVLDTAIGDVVTTTIKASVLGAYGGEAAGGLAGAYDDYMDGKKLEDIRKDGGKVLTQEEMTKLKQAKSAADAMKSMLRDALVPNFSKPLNAPGQPGGWDKAIRDLLSSSDLDQKIDKALEKGKVPDLEKSKVKEVLKNLSKDGVFGTAGALISIVAATLTLTNAGGNAEATPEERMTAAFYLLFAVSSSPTAVSAIGDPLAKLLGRNGVTQVLGLDKNMADALKGRLGPDFKVPDPSVKNPGDASKLFADMNANSRTPAGNQVVDAFEKMPKSEQNAIMRSVDKMAHSAGTAYTNLSQAEKLKLFGPGLKLIANTSYLGGALLGVYMGADAISNLTKDSTDIEKTQAALSLAAGLAWTGAAGAGFAAWAGAGAAAGTVGTALGAVGIILSVIGLGIASAIQYEKQEKAADEVRDYFTALDGMGVMEEDWGDKFNYLANVQYNYVESDEPEVTDEWFEYYFPDDMPVWEAQPEQYEAFTEMNGETTKNWWSFVSGDSEDLLTGHGEEPEGDMYKPSNEPAWRTMRG